MYIISIIEESPRGYQMAYEDRVGQRPGIDAMRDLVCTQKTRPRILPAWRNHPVSTIPLHSHSPEYHISGSL